MWCSIIYFSTPAAEFCKNIISLQCFMLLHTTKTKDPESQAIQLRSSKSIWIIYSNLNAKHTSKTLPSTHTPFKLLFPNPILNIENWILDIESLPYQGHGPHPSCLRAVRAKQQGLWQLGRQLNPCHQSRGKFDWLTKIFHPKKRHKNKEVGKFAIKVPLLDR